MKEKESVLKYFTFFLHALPCLSSHSLRRIFLSVFFSLVSANTPEDNIFRSAFCEHNVLIFMQFSIGFDCFSSFEITFDQWVCLCGYVCVCVNMTSEWTSSSEFCLFFSREFYWNYSFFFYLLFIIIIILLNGTVHSPMPNYPCGIFFSFWVADVFVRHSMAVSNLPMNFHKEMDPSAKWSYCIRWEAEILIIEMNQ